MRVLFLTHIYPTVREPTRGPFNQNLFVAIARRCEARVVVPEAWWKRSRQPAELFKVPHESFTGIEADIPTYWSVPRVTRMHAQGMYASLREYIRRLRKEFPFDVILAAWAYPDAVAASRLARDFGCPVVINILGSDINHLTTIPALCSQITEGLGRAYRVVTVSSALRDRVIDIGILADKVRVIHNGVNGEEFAIKDASEARTELGIPTTGKLICYVGRLSREKGVDVLVDAVSCLLRHGRTGATLALVGGGGMEAELRASVRTLKVEDKVRFLGMVPHADVHHWVSACNVLCLPSRMEGCPNVVLEALASGRPVVASRIGGIPELLTDENGIMVPPENSSALAEGLEAALSKTWDPHALRSSVESLSWDDVGDKYFSVLEEAVRADTLSLRERVG